MNKLLLLLATSILATACASGAGTRRLASSDNWLPGQPLPVSESPLFGAGAPVELSLSAEFDRVHKAGSGGNWTGEERADPKFWSQARLGNKAAPNRIMKANLRARGMSSGSEGESSFPKLRVEIEDAEDLKGTVFKGARNFRLNTHVDSNPRRTHTKMGRLVGEASPYREALGLEWAQSLELPTPAFRRARIDYEDTGLRQKFTRNALAIETDKKFAERFGGRLVSPQDFGDQASRLDLPLAIRFHFFHALIGNADYGLKLKNEPVIGTETYRPLFNTVILELADSRLVPMVYDLDFAFLVSGARGLVKPGSKALGIPDALADSVLALANLRARLSRREYEDGIAFIRARLPVLEKIARAAAVDEAGRKVALACLADFLGAVEILRSLPMLTKNQVGFYRDPGLKETLLRPMPLSDEEGKLRAGTPIKVLEIKGGVAKIAVLDTRFLIGDLADPAQSVGYIAKEDLVTGFDLPPELQGLFDERDMTF